MPRAEKSINQSRWKSIKQWSPFAASVYLTLSLGRHVASFESEVGQTSPKIVDQKTAIQNKPNPRACVCVERGGGCVVYL